MCKIHTIGEEVYLAGHPSICGIIRCTYQLSDGTVWCVVEQKNGQQVINRQLNWRKRKHLEPTPFPQSKPTF